MPLIKLGNGKQVHIRDVSAEKDTGKTPIVFIHGLGSSQNFYGSLIPVLSKERRCVCLDTPGSARSPTPKGDQSVQSISKDIIALLDELKLEKVVLVGHSMGGIIVCNVAAEYTDRVDKLILVGPVHPTEKGHKTFEDRIKLVKKEGVEPLADSVPTSATGSKSTPLAKAFIRELILGQTPEGYISLCNVIVTASPPKYSNIKCPTVIIAGDEDKSAPIDGCKTIQSGIGDNAKLKVIDGIGHWHCIEAPDEVTQIITHFL